MLQPVKPKRISDQVFEQLRDLIYRGRLKPGERLPPERELAQSLTVSRPTVREAINKLVVIGVLEHRQGQGTFVRSPKAKAEMNPWAAVMNGDDANLVDLLEVRLGLECTAVSLAAQRATEEDIQELERSLQEMSTEIDRGGLGHHEDVSFHMAIAYATKNQVQVSIMRNLYDLLFYGIGMNLQRLYSQPENLKRVFAQHTEIVTSIRRRDADAAAEAMKRHITYVLDFFKARKTL